MALYARTGPQGHIHHVALLVSPKKPDADAQNTWRLHAMNRPNPAFATSQEWQYQAVMVSGRTARLIALVLLGKTERSGEDIGEILKAVELTQDDPSWTCKEWVFGAIEILIAQGLIDRPPIPLEELYNIASTLADEFKKTPAEGHENDPVPTIGNSGMVIASEVK